MKYYILVIASFLFLGGCIIYIKQSDKQIANSKALQASETAKQAQVASTATKNEQSASKQQQVANCIADVQTKRTNALGFAKTASDVDTVMQITNEMIRECQI